MSVANTSGTVCPQTMPVICERSTALIRKKVLYVNVYRQFLINLVLINVVLICMFLRYKNLKMKKRMSNLMLEIFEIKVSIIC